MKALSLWQPWATAVAIGAKKNETRCWWTRYRGELAIHAAKLDTPGLRAFFQSSACDPLRDAGITDFYLTDQERKLGDYSTGRFAWIFADAQPMEPPVPCRGYQGLFGWPASQDETLPLFAGAL